LGIVGWAALGFGLLLLVLALIPAGTSGLGPGPDPATSYDEAVERFDVYAAQEGAVFEPCASRLLTYGEQTEAAVVLIHGLTNCPRQFVELGDALHARGANVLILRVPYHGLAGEDGTTIGGVGNVGGIRAEDLRDYADAAVDIAEGLGEDVRVLGLSAGGVMTAWIAQNRDVDRAVVIAPAISLPGGMPDFLDSGFRNVFSRFPNVSLPSGGKLDHAYTGESTRALAEMYVLAKAVQDQAAERPPAAGSIAVVTNANDDQVDNDDVRRLLVDAWRSSGEQIETFEFPKDLGLRHDLIDVGQPDQKTELVYPRLIGLLGL
jgi:carboxylesterase